MKKRGFTLIELLAVIVILAIIALIATPIVMNMIENSKKGAAARSADNYLRAVETAIATERIEGPVQDGEYEVDEDGNLVLGEVTIQVDVNGDKPAAGSKVKINSGLVDKANTILTIKGYPLTYNEKSKAFEVSESSGEVTLTDLCDYQGIDESKKYEYGAEYLCNLGDGVPRTFYVLDQGTDAVLLIMNMNYTDDTVPTTMSWCASGNDNSCNHDNLDPYIDHIQEVFGDDVEVSLPTYSQLGGNSIRGAWLYENLTNNEDKFGGYWTSDAENYGSLTNAYAMYASFDTNDNADYAFTFAPPADDNYTFGIRPVITLTK